LGLTVQNEPMAKQTWESCIYTAEEERDFVKIFRSNIKKMLDLRQKNYRLGS
jgi:glucosylceramidase